MIFEGSYVVFQTGSSKPHAPGFVGIFPLVFPTVPHHRISRIFLRFSAIFPTTHFRTYLSIFSLPPPPMVFLIASGRPSARLRPGHQDTMFYMNIYVNDVDTLSGGPSDDPTGPN